MIDLHLHSQYSEDGEYSPEELVRQCYQKGVRILSITDHNCARANEAALKAAKRKIWIIPGIEIDCVHTGNNLHILGYDIDFTALIFKNLRPTSMNKTFVFLWKLLKRRRLWDST